METQSTKAETQHDAGQSDRERVLRYHKKALDYQMNHPDAALGQARKAAEAVCRHICIKKLQWNPDRPTLETLLVKLNSAGLLPQIILLHLNTIQKFGNFGLHDQGEESDNITAHDIEPCIIALSNLVTWFLDVYHPDASVELNPTILASAPQVKRPEGEPVAQSALSYLAAPVEPKGALKPNAGRIADLDIASQPIAARHAKANGFWHRVYSARMGSAEEIKKKVDEDWHRLIQDYRNESHLKRLGYLFLLLALAYIFAFSILRCSTQEETTLLVTVTILPPEVVKLGAKWRIGPEYRQLDPARRVDGGSWLNSNESIPFRRHGLYGIEFSEVFGWQAPAKQFIDSSSASHIFFRYVRLPPQPQPSDATSITVMIHPADAANAGAGWMIDGFGEWKRSGDKIDLLVATNVSVIFSELSGWRKPSRIRVDADRSGAIPLDATYEKIYVASDSGTVPISPDPATHQADLGYLSVTIEPREAVQAGARWKIPGGEWQHSGAEIGPLVLIPVAVSFSSVSGWTKPESLEAGIKAGSNQIIGNYRPVDH